jgi:hypothetical protein
MVVIVRIERVLLLALPVLVWAHASLAAERTVVFTNARVVPMTSETVLEDRAVVVRGSRIAQVVRSKDLRIPEGAEVIDCRGAYLMPGLADMHTHLNDALFPHPFFNLFLANGVTTIRDLAQGSPPAVLAYRREIGSGARLGPHIYAANTYWGWEKDPIAVFRAQQPLGYDCAKINSYFSPEPFDALVREARRAHVYTLGHIPYAVGLEGVLAAGMNEVSHVDELILSEMIGLDHTQSLEQEEWEGLLVERAKETYRPYLQATPDEIERAFGPVAKRVVGRLKGKDLAFTTTLLCDEDIADKLLRREKLETAAHAPYVAPQFWKDLDAGTDRHMKMLAGEERGFLVLYELDRIVLREMKKNGVVVVVGVGISDLVGHFLVFSESIRGGGPNETGSLDQGGLASPSPVCCLGVCAVIRQCRKGLPRVLRPPVHVLSLEGGLGPGGGGGSDRQEADPEVLAEPDPSGGDREGSSSPANLPSGPPANRLVSGAIPWRHDLRLERLSGAPAEWAEPLAEDGEPSDGPHPSLRQAGARSPYPGRRQVLESPVCGRSQGSSIPVHGHRRRHADPRSSDLPPAQPEERDRLPELRGGEVPLPDPHGPYRSRT